MILSQISYLDCMVFLLFLAPQLLLRVGFFTTIICGLQALPFLLFQLPIQFIEERYLTRKEYKSPFVRHASPFQDFVIRCVRYAFARIPAKVGRVFFSKGVALPFLVFRMLRHGYLKSPIHWQEIEKNGIRGLWMIYNEHKKPDIIIFYCHGGGFSMGSSYFYLEFLFAYLTLLKAYGYMNPAIFAPEYTLVPDAAYPTQLEEISAGYSYVCSLINDDASKICVAGDSAGATLVLSLLLRIAQSPDSGALRPGYATLISPWVTIVSDGNRDTLSDYLNASSLSLYGSQYASSKANLNSPLVSPGVCKDTTWWAKASPAGGFLFVYGSEEVLAPETRRFIKLLRKSGCAVSAREEPAGIHAWPVVTLFLSDTQEARVKGIKEIVKMVRQHVI